MNLGLEGKAALVTAATRGLGFATAAALAREGAHVVICGRDTARLEEAVAVLRRDANAEVHAIRADVCLADDLKHLFGQVRSLYGGLDVLVTNAGGPAPGEVMTIGEDKWAAAYELTLMSVVRSVRLAVPLMVERGGGSVLAIVSSSVERPIPNLVLSNAFRPAVQGFCRTAAGELAPLGIRVNCLAPGRIATDRLRELDLATAERLGIAVKDIEAEASARIPMRRAGAPEEFGSVAAFLCSDAASYVTGATLMVDGGSLAAR